MLKRPRKALKFCWTSVADNALEYAENDDNFPVYKLQHALRTKPGVLELNAGWLAGIAVVPCNTPFKYNRNCGVPELNVPALSYSITTLYHRESDSVDKKLVVGSVYPTAPAPLIKVYTPVVPIPNR